MSISIQGNLDGTGSILNGSNEALKVNNDGSVNFINSLTAPNLQVGASATPSENFIARNLLDRYSEELAEREAARARINELENM